MLVVCHGKINCHCINYKRFDRITKFLLALLSYRVGGNLLCILRT